MRPVLHGALDLPETVAGSDGDDLEQRREHDRPEGEQAKHDQHDARRAVPAMSRGHHGSTASQRESCARLGIEDLGIENLGTEDLRIEDLGIADLGIENSVLI